MYDYGMIDIMYHMFRPTIDGIITRYSGMDEAAYIVLGLASVVFIAGAFTHHKLWLKAFELAILMLVAEGLRLVLMWIKHMEKRMHVII